MISAYKHEQNVVATCVLVSKSSNYKIGFVFADKVNYILLIMSSTQVKENVKIKNAN